MAQDRLVDLARLSIESKLAIKVDFDDIIKSFAILRKLGKLSFPNTNFHSFDFD